MMEEPYGENWHQPNTTEYSRIVRPSEWYGLEHLHQTKAGVCDIILVNIKNTLLPIIG